jgi:threo-3-hydroxy-L-aspartate ammonia-lyase
VTDLSAARLVVLDDIRAAADRLRTVTLRTPLLRLPTASHPHAYVKPENLQPMGAFKLRGAYNAIAQLTPAQLRRGVVTHSSGNHGQAVAYVAGLLGTRAVVVMPDNAPNIKVLRVREFGGEIVFVEPSGEARQRVADELVQREGLVLIPAADDARVICGQGTIGLEIVEQLADLPTGAPDRLTVVVPVGQGGLAAGVGTAVKALRPDARVVGVEPALAADTRESLARGEIVRWPSEKVQRTMADGLRMESVAALPFAHLQRCLDDIVTVEEEEIAQALARAAVELRLVVEPSGAVSLAAIYRYEELRTGTVVAVLSGGNVDAELYAELLRRYHRP